MADLTNSCQSWEDFDTGLRVVNGISKDCGGFPDCFFHVLCFELKKRNQIYSISELRKAIADLLSVSDTLEQRQADGTFATLCNVIKDAQNDVIITSPADYLNALRSNLYGGDIEIGAVCALFNLHIQLYSTKVHDGNHIYISHYGEGDDVVNIAMFGNHYRAVLFQTTTLGLHLPNDQLLPEPSGVELSLDSGTSFMQPSCVISSDLVLTIPNHLQTNNELRLHPPQLTKSEELKFDESIRSASTTLVNYFTNKKDQIENARKEWTKALEDTDKDDEISVPYRRLNEFIKVIENVHESQQQLPDENDLSTAKRVLITAHQLLGFAPILLNQVEKGLHLVDQLQKILSSMLILSELRNVTEEGLHVICKSIGLHVSECARQADGRASLLESLAQSRLAFKEYSNEQKCISDALKDYHNSLSQISEVIAESAVLQRRHSGSAEFELLLSNHFKRVEACHHHVSNWSKSPPKVLILGETSSGKSSLVDALCGQELLPIAYSQNTANIWEISYGTEPQLQRCEFPLFDDNDDTMNPARWKVVETVKGLENVSEALEKYKHSDMASKDLQYLYKLSWPVPFLKCGVTLVDSPGLGSSFTTLDKLVKQYITTVSSVIVILDKTGLTDKINSILTEFVEQRIKYFRNSIGMSDLQLSKLLSESFLFVQTHLDLCPFGEVDQMFQTIVDFVAKWWIGFGLGGSPNFICANPQIMLQSVEFNLIEKSTLKTFSAIREFIIGSPRRSATAMFLPLNNCIVEIDSISKRVVFAASRPASAAGLDSDIADLGKAITILKEKIFERLPQENVTSHHLEAHLRSELASANFREFLRMAVESEYKNPYNITSTRREVACEREFWLLVTKKIREMSKEWLSARITTLRNYFATDIAQLDEKANQLSEIFRACGSTTLERSNRGLYIGLTVYGLVGLITSIALVTTFGLFGAIPLAVAGLAAAVHFTVLKVSGDYSSADLFKKLVNQLDQFNNPSVVTSIAVAAGTSSLVSSAPGGTLPKQCNQFIKIFLDTLSDYFWPHLDGQLKQYQLIFKTAREMNSRKKDLWESLKGDIQAVSDSEPVLWLRLRLQNKLIDTARVVISDIILGTGMYGNVFEATLDGNTVAAKKLEWSAVKGTSYNWANEVNALSHVEHENIVRWYGVLEKDGYVYLIFERLGDTLGTRVRSNSAASLETRLKWVCDIARGLQYLHCTAQFAHRDIAPANIMFTSDGTDRVVIGDLGSTKLIGESMMTPCSTLLFAAPEAQPGNNGYEGTAADIFSLGRIITYVLSGDNSNVFHYAIDELRNSCTNSDPTKRPGISFVLAALSKLLLYASSPRLMTHQAVRDILDQRRPVRMLCLDGGGSRGILQCAFLEALEEKCGKRLHELFDFVSGTSTGAILGSGIIVNRLTATQLKDLYLGLASRIFPAGKVNTVFSIAENNAFYSEKPLENALKNTFGNSSLIPTDNTQTYPRLCIITKRGAEVTPFILRNYESTTLSFNGAVNWEVWKACRASSAAVPYFPPFRHVDALYYDGGFGHNNPTRVAMDEVSALGWVPKVIVSISTGSEAVNTNRIAVGPYGLLSVQWKNFLIGQLTQTEDTHVSVQKVCDGLKIPYFRLNMVWPDDKPFGLDIGDPVVLREVYEAARLYVRTEKVQLKLEEIRDLLLGP